MIPATSTSVGPTTMASTTTSSPRLTTSLARPTTSCDGKHPESDNTSSNDVIVVFMATTQP